MSKKNAQKAGLVLLIFLLALSNVNAQSPKNQIRNYLKAHQSELNLTDQDLTSWTLTDLHTAQHNDVTYAYLHQLHNQVEVVNGVSTAALQKGEMVYFANRMYSDIASKVNADSPSLTPIAATEKAAAHLGLAAPEDLKIISVASAHAFQLNDGGISRDPIAVKLVYQATSPHTLVLAWEVVLNDRLSNDWWQVYVDATTGTLLDTFNRTQYCGVHPHAPPHPLHASVRPPLPAPLPRVHQPDAYNVFPMPVESPNHGPRQLVSNPADSLASPFGWHDIDGITGADFQITHGNNAWSYTDVNATNFPGASPLGTPTLDFDFPLNLNQPPATNADAAVTNLFYWTNIMHDVWYHYGFTETAGNYQQNNYGRGGLAQDLIFSEAQDGSGTSNANFTLTPDGQGGRLQTFLWPPAVPNTRYLTVNHPAVIQGGFTSEDAIFGPGLPTSPLTADMVIADDGTAPTSDACDPLVNAAAANGKIVLIDRGACNFVVKVKNAQNAGAVGVVIVNNVAGPPIQMGGTDPTITIPSIMVSQADGNLIRSRIAAGDSVNATLLLPPGNVVIDGAFDNGIVAHEYGHGISSRLIGGPSIISCQSNDESVSEGWSDFFSFIMTIEAGDSGHHARGVGTFALREPVTGIGGRNAQYTTDTSVNPYTYQDTNDDINVSQPHGIGFIWCSMMWDLTWALIDQYGFDPDFYQGTGGNNIAMQLAIDAMKLQPCGAGFVEARDAVLMADQLNNGGANQCLIWTAFANRGLGFSADQGLEASRLDQVEAFDLHPLCLTPTLPPTAGFTYETFCNGVVEFADSSTNLAQYWEWDFGDGGMDSVPHPTHTYTTDGTYLVTLIVRNTLGTDTLQASILVANPAMPTNILADTGCAGLFTLSAQGANSLVWKNANGTTVGFGPVFNTPVLSSTTTFTVSNFVSEPQEYVGPIDRNFGTGSYLNTNVTSSMNFTAFKPLTIASLVVYPVDAGNRTITVWDGPNATGNIVDQTTVFLNAFQPVRIPVALNIPAAGDYSLGGADLGMYRNQTGANYPYTVPGLLSITSSDPPSGLVEDPMEGYYWFYDWEIQQDTCFSQAVPVTVEVTPVDFTSTTNQRTVSFTAQAAGSTSWLWDFGDGDTSTQQNPTHTYTNNGTYLVRLTVDPGSCFKQKNVTISVTGQAELATSGPQIELIPNPASNFAELRLSSEFEQDIEITLVDVTGKVLRETVLKRGIENLRLDLTGYVPGMYFVRLSAKGYAETRKVVVMR